MVNDYIEKARVVFPRLFFLSDNDLLSLLAWSRNPKDLLPFVRKCFPGIKNLQFALPKDGNLKMASSLDTALNGNTNSQLRVILGVRTRDISPFLLPFVALNTERCSGVYTFV